MLNPVIGLIDHGRDRHSGQSQGTVIPRSKVDASTLRGTWFGDMTLANSTSIYAKPLPAPITRTPAKKHNGLPSIDFGVVLHVGTVIYGMVGTEKRLDFTATGLAAEMVCRCEAMTRDLNTPILATAAFAAKCLEPEQPQGSFEIRGFSTPAEWVAYPPTTN